MKVPIIVHEFEVIMRGLNRRGVLLSLSGFSWRGVRFGSEDDVKFVSDYVLLNRGMEY